VRQGIITSTRSGVSRRRRAAIINVTISPVPPARILSPESWILHPAAFSSSLRRRMGIDVSVLVIVWFHPPPGILVCVRWSSLWFAYWCSAIHHRLADIQPTTHSSSTPTSISHQDVWPESGRKRCLFAYLLSYSCGLDNSTSISTRFTLLTSTI